MPDRIGKGSLCDPFTLDDGVESREGHHILGKGVKIPLCQRLPGMTKNGKGLKKWMRAFDAPRQAVSAVGKKTKCFTCCASLSFSRHFINGQTPGI